MLHDNCTIHSIKVFVDEIVQELRETEVVNLWIREKQYDCTIDFSSILLTDREQARAHRFNKQSDRDCFVFRRKLLKLILAKCTSLDIIEIPVHGRLIWEKGVFYFSHSNKNGSLWYSFSTCYKIGADLEEHDVNMDYRAITSLFFSEQEQTACQKKIFHFFKRWTQKEALAKCAYIPLYQALQTPIIDHKKDLAQACIANRKYYIYSRQKGLYHISIAAIKQPKTMKTYEQAIPSCRSVPYQLRI